MTDKTPTPPAVRLRDLARVIEWIEYQERIHIWVELLDRVVVFHRTDPATMRRCKSAHVGIWGAFVDAGVFLEAVNKAIEKCWRAH